MVSVILAGKPGVSHVCSSKTHIDLNRETQDVSYVLQVAYGLSDLSRETQRVSCVLQVVLVLSSLKCMLYIFTYDVEAAYVLQVFLSLSLI